MITIPSQTHDLIVAEKNIQISNPPLYNLCKVEEVLGKIKKRISSSIKNSNNNNNNNNNEFISHISWVDKSELPKFY